MYRAHAGKTELDDDAVVKEMDYTRPLSVVLAEHIQALREWVQDRTVLAG